MIQINQADSRLCVSRYNIQFVSLKEVSNKYENLAMKLIILGN